jgi:glycosyltransferase involved in cell wall biosynthesis
LKVSIVTTVRNAEETIQQNICSVNSQTFEDWEHIIVDGLSTDGTTNVVNSMGSDPRRFMISERDSGPLEGMNKGIGLSTGTIIGFLNADDVFFDSFSLQRIVDAFGDPEVYGCYGDLEYTDKYDLEKTLRVWSMGKYSSTKLMFGWTAAHPTFYVRANVFDEIGGFDPFYYLQSDFEFVVRFFYKYQYRAVYIAEPLVKMRSGGISNGSLRNIVLQNIYNYRALKYHGVPVSLLYPFIRIASRLNQFLKVKMRK